MDTVFRAAAIYLVLLLVFRLIGKRSLGQITTFDFVLLLIIGESAQQALIGDDFSITTAALLITTLLSMELGLSMLKQHLPALDRWVDGLPLVIVEDGKPLADRMARERVDEEDVLEAARELHGLERMNQVKYAVLERNGAISVIPVKGATP